MAAPTARATYGAACCWPADRRARAGINLFNHFGIKQSWFMPGQHRIEEHRRQDRHGGRGRHEIGLHSSIRQNPLAMSYEQEEAVFDGVQSR